MHGLNTYPAHPAVLTDFAIDPGGRQHHFGRQLNRGGGGDAQIGTDREASLGQAIQVTNDIHGGLELVCHRHNRVALTNRVMRQTHTLLFGELREVIVENLRGVDREEQVVRARGVGSPAMECRVELI